ncbi:hypothetical protein FC093_05555 [Ilyomonas limi]|uniref:ATPase dynein-related AAA domain-containing protein n=1 Tax=Ilyomonas limi TaxID=2575867 RepID=A0A4U3L508_9BACT|nr:AAA family ATPase [Ilyomonas limi]TKK70215.1 hypothetical protein FC093_05555 [Ilyomonas limi]
MEAKNAPQFFTQEDFTQLAKFAKQPKEKDNSEHQQTYDYLKETYNKVKYWAEQTQHEIFPNGIINILLKPTNQANRFEDYQWGKIYHDSDSEEEGILAYTVGIHRNNFVIKIDTVGLKEADKKRQQYYERRGDENNSDIVKIVPSQQVLDKSWKYLIDLSAAFITSLQPAYKELYNLLVENANLPERREQKTIKENNMPLNCIFYGPPGTGKTYHTIDRAIEIADQAFYDENKHEREKLKQRFNELLIKDFEKTDGQIAFCTFHQSMSYEDFIEGIKPVKPEQSGSVYYEVLDGIFKKICLEANRSIQYSVTIDNVQNSLTRELFEDYYYNFSETLPEHTESSSPVVLKTKENYSFELFRNTADSIVVKAGDKKTNLSVSCSELAAVLFQNKKPTYKSYEEMILHKILENKGFQKSEVDNRKKNYVLIIDEINRGNIAQIFGELITLIEEDKRGGQKEELEVVLPYSKKPFKVPSNLFIIGTMNTADRSVEALDTALRRRFVFEAMEPKPELLDTKHLLWWFLWKYKDDDWKDLMFQEREREFYNFFGVDEGHKEAIERAWYKMEEEDMNLQQIALLDEFTFTGVNLFKMLSVINSRLQVLLSKDHTIGHAWLMNVYSLSDLQHAFKNKILPLLQEYFYNNYAKIGLVLGQSFVEQVQVNKSLFAKFTDSEETANDYEGKTIYTLVDPFALEAAAFKSIYE